MRVNLDRYRDIPDFPDIVARDDGIICKKHSLDMLSQVCRNGYYYCRLTVGLTESRFSRRMNHRGKMIPIKQKRMIKPVAVHQLVASAWIGKKPTEAHVVNHIDGDGTNNHYKNLEWVTQSENSVHAAEYLRGPDCEAIVRDYETGKIYYFDSIAEAKNFMGVPMATLTSQLNPIRFGVLLNERYEFRHPEDHRPWFYETHKEKVEARYWTTVTFEDGRVEEIFTAKDVARLFPDAPKSLVSLKQFMLDIPKKYPGTKIVFRDSYDEDPYKDIRAYKRNRSRGIWLYDLKNNTETVIDNVHDVAVFLGITSSRVRTLLRDIRPYRDRWLIARTEDRKYIDGLKKINSVSVRPERNSSNCGDVLEVDNATTTCSKETSTPSE